MENLFETKQKLIDKLKEAEDEHAKAKSELKTEESRLWLETNFKELGCTNEDLRKAYVNRETNTLKLNKDLKANEIIKLKRELNLCDDKIKLLS